MKKQTYNRRTAVLLLLLATLSLTRVFAIGLAQDKLPAPSGHINDFAAVLDTANKERLESILEQLKTRTEIDLVIAVVKTAALEDLYEYSLRLANDWNIGSRTSQRKTLLLVVSADNGKFFTQFSRPAQTALPDGLVGEMGRKMGPKLEAKDYDAGLLIGVQTFVGGLGETHNFTLADLDPQAGQLATRTRPRTVESSPTPADTPQPSESPLPSESRTPAAVATPSETPAPTVETPSPTATSQPTTVASPAPTETASISPTPNEKPSETPVESPTPVAAASKTPPGIESAPTPAEFSGPTPEVARNNSSKPPRTARESMTRTTPADEKEEVELTLTKPPAERIDLLKKFIASHPKSVANSRAQELIITAHATLGDQKLAAGDIDGGLDEFSSALEEVPADMSDRLFVEVIAKIPMNLFIRGQRGPAFQAAHQVEGMAKLIPARLLAVTQFYLGIEDVTEANRLAELTVQNAPDMAAAHQALAAARHIALRLEDAQAEYEKALSLNPKLMSAKLGWADLQRAAGKSEAALAAYREVSQAEPKNNAAIAGAVLSLLDLGKKDEANQELNAILQDTKARNLPLLVGASYWFVAHGDSTRALELAQKAVALEPRYSWGQIAAARALVANKRPLEAERGLRFARTYARFPTLDYELATVLASVGLYDEALTELSKTFSLKDRQIETKLAGRVTRRAATFTDLLAPERHAAIFQNTSADTEANAKMMKGLMAFASALNPEGGRSTSDDDLVAIAQDFIAGNDPIRTYRQVYVASKLLRKGVALTTVVDLMDSATSGVEAALGIPAATVAIQPEELADRRARALAQGGTPDVPDAPRAALSAILRARIEDIAGMALLNLDKTVDAVARLRRAVSVAPQGTPLWRSSMWHLATGLEADGKHDQALLYYINSYRAGAPDPARRAVIESIYKKVNGSLEGLDDKIGPAYSSSAPAASPTP